MEVNVPVSVGELVDKLTILEIKAEFIKDSAKRQNIVREEDLLKNLYNSKIATVSGAAEKKSELKSINLQLWKVEDEIRDMEKSKKFNDEFVKLARAVYHLNDKRAEIKKEINLLSGSALVEEKSYSQY